MLRRWSIFTTVQPTCSIEWFLVAMRRCSRACIIIMNSQNTKIAAGKETFSLVLTWSR